MSWSEISSKGFNYTRTDNYVSCCFFFFFSLEDNIDWISASMQCMRRWGELDKRRKVAHGELPPSAIRRGRPPGKKGKNPKPAKSKPRRRDMEDEEEDEEPDLDDDEEDEANGVDVPMGDEEEGGEPGRKKRRHSQLSKAAGEEEEGVETEFDEVINTEETITRSGRKTRRVVTGSGGGSDRM
jgi:hypothetical protein